MRRYVGTIAISALALFTFLTPKAFCWSVSYSHETKKVKVTINERVDGVHPYLVWGDLDEGNKGRFFSVVKDLGWKEGIQPFQSEPMNILPFGEAELGALPAQCPAGHRCFLFLVALAKGHPPHELGAWKEVSILPLSIQAARERLPGQNKFLLKQQRAEPDYLAQPSLSGSGDVDEAVQGNPESQRPETEKPDVYKIDGTKILYANASGRFQVIDWSDPSAPRLVISIPLEGMPEEIYSINGHYIILQRSRNDIPASRQSGGTMVKAYALAANQLKLEDSLELKGTFLESRRRGNLIYLITVAQSLLNDNASEPPSMSPFMPEPNRNLVVTALEVTQNGTFELRGQKRITNIPRNTVAAIFPDYLLYAYNNDNYNLRERSSSIVLFDIRDPGNPLPRPKIVKVPGYIPSEFHLDVRGSMLRVVSSPDTWNRESGSTLSIFDISKDNPRLVGQLKGIAPSEDLFATRFEGSKAYVITYERKDPLWVIDMADPARPRLLAHLEVPGWSEKLFINGSRLLGLGVYDQPLPGENQPFPSFRRVAVSLFDIEHPSSPRFIDRLVPLADETQYTSSQALGDERAFLIDWDRKLCAFPITRYDRGASHYIQLCSLDDQYIEDLGHVQLPVSSERVLNLDEYLVGGLGTYAFFTIDYFGTPEIVGSLELARNYWWIEYDKEMVWSATIVPEGRIWKLYGFEPGDLQNPVKGFAPKGEYLSLAMDDGLALFYNLGLLEIAVMDLNDGTCSKGYSMLKSADGGHVNRVIFKNRKIFASAVETIGPRPLDQDLSIFPPPNKNETVALLRIWQVEDLEQKPKLVAEATVPGDLVGVTDDGKILLKESSERDQMVLNLVSMKDGQAVLEKSRVFDCDPVYSNIALNEAGRLFAVCMPRNPFPIVIMEGDTPDSYSKKDEIPAPTQVPKLLAIDSHTLEIEASKTFDQRFYLADAFSDLVIVKSDRMYLEPLGAQQNGSTAARKKECNVYRISGKKFELVKRFSADVCDAVDLAFSDSMLYGAYGLKGLKAYELMGAGE